VLSAGETGGATAARRINGSLPIPESIQFSFNQDVTLESIVVGAIHTGGGETLQLALVSGSDPFGELAGYSGDFQVQAGSLTFRTTSGATTPLLIPFGAGGQEELVLAAGTVLSITANTAEGGGILFNSITVAVVNSPGDFNRDGIVDGADLEVWKVNFPATTTTNVPGDADADEDVDGNDFLTWQRGLSGGSPAAATPEPSCALLFLWLPALFSSAHERWKH
jgi:hypothetical protein